MSQCDSSVVFSLKCTGSGRNILTHAGYEGLTQIIHVFSVSFYHLKPVCFYYVCCSCADQFVLSGKERVSVYN